VSTVVLCGSLGATHAMWDAQLAPLEERFRVIRVDHPGHGGEPVADVREVRDLARHVLERVDADRFSFVGVSLGGAIGMRLALDVPERIDRLALLCTSARFGPPEMWRERAALVRADGVGALVDAVMGRWFTPSFADMPRYREMFLATDDEGYARCCDALASWDVNAELGGVAAPTLVISGSDDPSTPPDEHGALVAAGIPRARHEIVPDARHLANVERAEQVNQLLVGHL
jgi:3-oxoadipate enol-lactonase